MRSHDLEDPEVQVMVGRRKYRSWGGVFASSESIRVRHSTAFCTA